MLFFWGVYLFYTDMIIEFFFLRLENPGCGSAQHLLANRHVITALIICAFEMEVCTTTVADNPHTKRIQRV